MDQPWGCATVKVQCLVAKLILKRLPPTSQVIKEIAMG
jgi:hypothetical protein